MNLLIYFPHFIINIANAILAGKVLHQHLPIYLVGIYPLMFGLGAQFSSKLRILKRLNLVQFSIIWLLFICSNFIFIFSSSLFITCVMFFINSLLISLQNSYFVNSSKSSMWYLNLLAFGLGRIFGGFTGFDNFKLVFWLQAIVICIFLILTWLKIKIKVSPVYQNQISFNVTKLQRHILVVITTLLLTSWNYVYAVLFHQKATVTALTLLLTISLQILILAHKSLNKYFIKISTFLIGVIALSWYIYFFLFSNIILGIILINLTLLVCNLLLSNSLQTNSKFYEICLLQILCGLIFYYNPQIIFYLICIGFSLYVLNILLIKIKV